MSNDSAQRRQDRLAVERQDLVGDEVGDLAEDIVDGGHGGLNQAQVAEGAALVGVADQFQIGRSPLCSALPATA